VRSRQHTVRCDIRIAAAHGASRACGRVGVVIVTVLRRQFVGLLRSCAMMGGQARRPHG